MPTATRISGLIERCALRAYSGVSSSGLRCDVGSASSFSIVFSAASCSGVRLTIHTGLPRHSTVSFSPGWRALISTSTAAPAARARSDGWKLLTNGTATAAPPTTPAQLEAISQVLLLLSTCRSLMRILECDFPPGQPPILADGSATSDDVSRAAAPRQPHRLALTEGAGRGDHLLVAAASRSAMRMAAARLDASARPLPARSKAVPWSGLVRTKGSPSVTLTPCSTPRYLTGISP